MRQATIFFVSIISVMLNVGCSINKAIQPVEKNTELANFLNQTNLVYLNDMYWVKDVPQPETSLGAIYEKIDKTIQTKDGAKEFSAFKFSSGRLFSILTGTSIRKDPLLYSNEYSYNANDSANLAVMSVFTGAVDNVFQIDRKVELKEAWQPNVGNVTLDTKYCDIKYYYVSRLWLGASSDLGSHKIKYQMKVAAVSVGTELTGLETTSLHTVKQGAIAFNLEPVSNLSGCESKSKNLKKSFKALSLETDSFIPEPLNVLENELIKKAFKKTVSK